MTQKNISVKAGQLLHVETPNGIVNIRCGLTDTMGRQVDSIACTPDDYAGELPVKLFGLHNTRMVRLKKRPKRKA